MSVKDVLLALLVVIIWGANFTVIKVGLEGIPPMLMVAMRYLIVAIPAVFFFKRPIIKARYWILYGAAVGVGQFGCLFYAMYLGVSAGIASILLQAQAFFTFLMAAVILREPVSRLQPIGLLISMAGLYLVVGVSSKNSSGQAPALGILLCLGGAFFWGLSNIIICLATRAIANHKEKLDILGLIVWSSLIPPIPLFLLALLSNSVTELAYAVINMSGVSLFSILFISFAATLFCYGVWSNLLTKYPTTLIAPLSLLVPLVGCLTAWFFLGETLSVLQIAGCGIVVIGLLVATVRLNIKPDRWPAK